MTIKEALSYGIEILKKNNMDNPINKAKIILAYLLNISKEQLIINYSESIDKEKSDKYMISINKVANGTPVQYITNSVEFMGLKLYVDENVLIPQPDTEILVENVVRTDTRTTLT